jgi:hypothetical protein
MNILTFCKNYTINSDGIVDVDGKVDLCNRLGDMTKLPVKFGKVSGFFACIGNNLTTLECCPKYVGGVFYCRNNKLTTLEGCPNYVGGDFTCDILTHHILGNIQGKKIYCNKQRIVI